VVVQPFARSTFLVACFWPDLDPEEVHHVTERLARCATQPGQHGTPVTCVGSILIAGDDVVFFLFEAGSSLEVQEVCEQAELQFERVVGSVVSARQ